MLGCTPQGSRWWAPLTAHHLSRLLLAAWSHPGHCWESSGRHGSDMRGQQNKAHTYVRECAVQSKAKPATGRVHRRQPPASQPAVLWPHMPSQPR